MQKEVPKKPPQSMQPHGLAGRVFGFFLERLSESNYRWVVDQLAVTRPRTYLEIGFGTGKLAGLVASDLKPACLCGVDPSQLMLERTSRRLRRFEKTGEIDLRLGDDRELPWAGHSFSAIVASASFQ